MTRRANFGTLALVKPFTPEDLLACYKRGVFPMAESRDDEGFFIVDPEWRCIFPLDSFHVPKRLARTLRQDKFTFTINRDFDRVIDGCAAPGKDREDTWINPDIRALYMELHRRGTAHSVETRIDGELIGGLYGVALGGAFFGESMFSWATDASKAALVQLAARLRRGGFKLLDAQFITPHLEQFGAQTLPRRIFQGLLGVAMDTHGDFRALPVETTGVELVEILRA
ncbi:MAG: leucyl/phenylalanyl-tRNA--protein transferase [Hyphomonadaceae bacterium]|nr:leucyl/phenylalanyl-tRNA--protein transferase [Hyphomonadaceae bacterium]